MSSDTPCVWCEELPSIWYCNYCEAEICEKCWEARGSPGHRRQDPRHVKISTATRRRFNSILNPGWTDERRSLQHNDDEAAVWFSVDKGDANALEFTDWDRYAQLVTQHSSTSGTTTFSPRVTSFIGPTGAGKSTLVRMLLERPWEERKSHPQNPEYEVPVIGILGSTQPTSGDVHLYRDPRPTDNEFPLFYADSEGFFGGEVPPIGSCAARRNALPSMESVRQVIMRAINKIPLILPEARRETAVTQLFPRLLYNFSDVVVYVVHSSAAGMMEKVLLQLLNWAGQSSTTSVNQPALPHVIIAINAASSTALWDPQEATDEIFRVHNNMIRENEDIRKHLENWRTSRVQVDNLKDLFLLSYSSVKFIWIPHGSSSFLISRQVFALYNMIDEASYLAKERKRTAGLLLSLADQRLFFRLAFEHYARNLDVPFDFLNQIFAMRPVPNTFSNNISQLLGAVRKATPSLITADTFRKYVVPIVSSAITVDAARQSNLYRGKLPAIFDGATMHESSITSMYSYKAQVERALEEFCNKRCPCEYSSFGIACVNARSTHAVGHQSASGDLLEQGLFQSTFVNELERGWRNWIKESLEETEAKIEHDKRFSSCEDMWKTVWALHRNNLTALYRDLSALDTKSICICFYCMSEIPVHILPCGHSICEPCARECNDREVGREQRLIFLSRCILHTQPPNFSPPSPVQLRPSLAGSRILALDGGGVRGIIELSILEAIENEFGGHIRIQRFFDLIGGTSTGGLIALGLGIQNWSIAECKGKYMNLCEEAFSARFAWTISNFLATITTGSMYQTTALETILKNEFGALPLYGAKMNDRLFDAHAHANKVFVTATKDDGKTATIIANYNRDCESRSDTAVYNFETREFESCRFKVWEAARGTSAAPAYFAPFEKWHEDFFDGGLFNNNPAHIANLESKLLWPSKETFHPDILLSIGSGHSSKQTSEADELIRGTVNTIAVAVTKFIKSFPILKTFSILKNRFEENLNSESLWNMHFATLSSEHPTRYVRLNLKFPRKQPLDDTSAFCDGSLANEASKYINANKTKIASVTRRLAAASFYFEPKVSPRRDLVGLTIWEGAIRCRFLNKSAEIKAFGTYLRRLSYPKFVVEGDDHTNWALTADILGEMESHGVFEIPMGFSIPGSATRLNILFKGSGFDGGPISGFPRTVIDAV